MIVVDVGCQSYHEHSLESIPVLVQRFKPALVYGFDLSPDLDEMITPYHGSLVITRRMGAWVHPGKARLMGSDHRLYVGFPDRHDHNAEMIETFDLALWLRTLPPVPTILKIDAVGGEQTIVPWLLARHALDCVTHLLIRVYGDDGLVTLRETKKAVPDTCSVEEW